MATDRLGDIRLFVEAAAQGTLSAAGRKLDLSPAAASARLFKLESVLKTKLFDRTTRKLRLTEEGKIYLEHCLIALQAIDNAEVALQASQVGISGKIRISASGDFGRNQLSQWIEEFCSLYPAVKIALTLTDSLSNLHQDDIDIAIRFAQPGNDLLIARRLAPNWRVLCASPQYLARHGIPRTPADLIHHHFIVLATSAGLLNEYHFAIGDDALSYTVSQQNAWETNDGAIARAWALAGHGITRKTIWDASTDIKAGRLVALLTDFIVTEPGVYAIYHQTRYALPRVRVFLDFLTECFSTATEQISDTPHPLTSA